MSNYDTVMLQYNFDAAIFAYGKSPTQLSVPKKERTVTQKSHTMHLVEG